MSAAAFELAGCATNDNGPLAPAPETTEPTTQFMTSPTPSPAVPQRKPETIPVAEVADVIFSSLLIKAELGGVVTAGRHRLTIPPGALKHDTNILLKDVTGSVGFVSCEAYPEGLEFLKPALLESSFRDLRSPIGYTIYWIANPGQPDEDWIDMRATFGADGQGLAIKLSHFSTYAPGKAGWAPRRGGPGHFRPIN